MAGNNMRFRSGEEDMNIPESVADSSGHHSMSKPRSDLGQRKCSR